MRADHWKFRRRASRASGAAAAPARRGPPARSAGCGDDFEPQPLELFAADKAPARITRLREKLGYLAESGVDYVLCVRFDRRFAALTAQDFISELLVRQLGVRFLAVGDDFRFGAGRQGDFLLLQKAGAEYGLTSPVPRPLRRWRTY